MVEASEPGPRGRPPDRPVVERARAETGHDTAGEDRRRDARATGMRCQDKRDAEAERGVEAELVKDAPQSRLDTLDRRDHRLSLGPPGSDALGSIGLSFAPGGSCR
jgi:hypothetical protein